MSNLYKGFFQKVGWMHSGKKRILYRGFFTEDSFAVEGHHIVSPYTGVRVAAEREDYVVAATGNADEFVGPLKQAMFGPLVSQHSDDLSAELLALHPTRISSCVLRYDCLQGRFDILDILGIDEDVGIYIVDFDKDCELLDKALPAPPSTHFENDSSDMLDDFIEGKSGEVTAPLDIEKELESMIEKELAAMAEFEVELAARMQACDPAWHDELQKDLLVEEDRRSMMTTRIR